MYLLPVQSPASSSWNSGWKGHTVKLKRDANQNNNGERNRPAGQLRLNFYNRDGRWSAGVMDHNMKMSLEQSGNSSSLRELERAELLRANYLNSIRTLGHSYMRPPGITKTIQTMLEEEEEKDEEGSVSPLHHGDEEDVDGSSTDLNNEDQAPTHTEDHVGPVADDDEWNVRITAGYESSILDNNEGNEVTDGSNVVLDLDTQIPDASDNDYDISGDDYDENEYQEGFMTEDEYDEPSINQSQYNIELENDEDELAISDHIADQSNILRNPRVGSPNYSGEQSGQPSFAIQSAGDMSSRSFLIDDGEDMSM